MGLEIERDFFKKIEKHYHSSSCVFFTILISDIQKTFVALQFAHPMT
jgi:hypothetical protein